MIPTVKYAKLSRETKMFPVRFPVSPILRTWPEKSPKEKKELSDYAKLGLRPDEKELIGKPFHELIDLIKRRHPWPCANDEFPLTIEDHANATIRKIKIDEWAVDGMLITVWLNDIFRGYIKIKSKPRKLWESGISLGTWWFILIEGQKTK